MVINNTIYEKIILHKQKQENPINRDSQRSFFTVLSMVTVKMVHHHQNPCLECHYFVAVAQAVV